MIALLLASLLAQDLRVLPEGKRPDDVRLGRLKDLDGAFPFEVPATREAWLKRSEELRLQTRVALGLLPEPERTPLNAKLWGKSERADFTVEKVTFESMPGLVTTGLLFRPKTPGRHPAVLSPHGHEGRLWDYGEAGVRKMIAEGYERFEKSGRMPQLARCANLARLGCVVLIHDMLGYADSVQIPSAVAHRMQKARPALETAERWGFFSPQAELRLQSILGVQAWTCIRGLDFLCSLPDVDPLYIGVTGSSGGGTQTIVTCALDPRPSVAFPQGMVSTSMQGGCTCENACYLRIGTGNVELTALFAPKPQGMTAANDWTKEMMTKGFPELEKLYALFGAKGAVSCRNHVTAPHNYNSPTRSLMYALFNKHLKLGQAEPILEVDFEPFAPAEVTLWDAEHPVPPSGEDVEVALLKAWAAESDRQLAEGDAKRRHELRAAGWNVMIGRRVPGAGSVQREKVGKEDLGGHWRFKDLLRCSGETLPVLTWHPKTWNGKVAIWADGAGKGAVAAHPDLKRLLDGGWSVMSADLLLQGESLEGGKPIERQGVVANPREYAGFTYGYNAPLFSKRVHDLLTLLSFVIHDEHAPKEVVLVGTGGAGPLAAAAGLQSGRPCFVDDRTFRFAALASYRHPDFLPGAVKYGDYPALLELTRAQDVVELIRK